jgi:hypothetical protein
MASECYTVKLWYTNERGFRQQAVVDIKLYNTDRKDEHARAEKEALLQFEGLKPEIISVKYQ